MKATLKQNKWLTAGITKWYDSTAMAEVMLPFATAPVMPRA